MTQLIIQSGLANQMFQYAFFLSLKTHSQKHKHYRLNTTEYLIWPIHNGYELGRVFGINEETVQYKSRIGKRWMKFLFEHEPRLFVCKDPKYAYFEKAYNSMKPYLLGYWMNPQYFAGIEDKIRQAFTFQGIDEMNAEIAREMQNCNSVALHVRRGDYLKMKNHFCICELDYYERALEFIKARIDSPIVYVFSDDIEWCYENINKLGVKYKIVDINRGIDSYKDMFLMTQCRHIIMANSTFSWWGAWLNRNPNKIVITPSSWFADNSVNFCPQSWYRL